MTMTTHETDAPPALTFSQRLREETMRPHREAESEPFIADLMAGRLDRGAYQALLEQYAVLYPTLEVVVREQPASSVLSAFDHPGLARTAAINADLNALAGPDRLPPVALPATRALAKRINSELPAERLLAHHYLRYLGDLSGGLAIGRLVSRHYGIEPEALSMWRFEGITKPKVFKDRYRALLDSAELSPAQQDAVIDEAAIGYRLNQAIFAELGLMHTAAA
ncbi:biliverdin-producing heme oxygenase [Brevibacterium gallinarum]|uniref:Biliverdin-producing heme oxygenase n=1 Tax=Brevibacterium gallinarum TaxID=2762220 RepID=A0ABR8WXC2_9MICO|nr:biliverdin-producing heme oxygenase [Brevibacterium gallinarum]MBD8021734.1 biliverdin-producing heme oxygenase [Brevibacterium gallinarum]